MKVSHKILQIGNGQSGFTLLELMVLIALIGIVSSFVAVNTYRTNAQADSDATLSMVVLTMIDKAQVDQRWYGLQVEEKRYRLMELSKHGWVPSGTKGWINLPDRNELTLSPAPSVHKVGYVYFYVNPTGLLSPYNLLLTTPYKQTMIEAPYDFSF